MMEFFGSKTFTDRFKILHLLWSSLKKWGKENVIVKSESIKENLCNQPQKTQFFTFSDLLFTTENSSTSCNYHSENQLALVSSQISIADTFENNFVEPLNLGQMLKSTVNHVFYYLHPSFLPHQSCIMCNDFAATGRTLNNLATWKGIYVISINLSIKDFNSLELLINQHLNKYSSSFFEEEKRRNDLIKNVIKTKNTINTKNAENFSPLPSKESKQKDYKKKNTTYALNCLFAELLQLSRDDAYAITKKHPYRNYVPLEQVKETYNFLVEKNYSLELIRDCSTILLYPKEKVEETLNFLYNSKVIEKDSEEKYALHLCLYYMEKPFHFSGHGVFPSEETEKE